MGLQTVPGYIGEAGFPHPVELDRNLLAAICGGVSGKPRSADWALALVGGSSFQLQLGPGNMFIMGTEGISTQGAYFAWSDDDETFLFAAPSASPRIDSLILRIIDEDYGADPGVSRAEFEIVQGAPAASPVQTPDSDFELGGPNYKPGAWMRVLTARINPGDTDLVLAQVTYLVQSLRISGGQLVVSSSTFYPADPGVGDVVYDISKGHTVRWNGSSWEGRSFSRQVFTNSGTYNKPVGARQIFVEVLGGAGAGGGSVAPPSGQSSMGGGGGGGGYANVLLDAASVASSVTVTVGNGGTGVTGTTGGDGGNSSFGSLCVATGGSGAGARGANDVPNGVSGGIGGIGTVGDVLARGGSGGWGWGSGGLGMSGNGGDSRMGGGAQGRRTGTVNEEIQGLDGGQYGGGGSGAISSGGGSSRRGGHGAKGVVVVVAYF